MYKKFSQGGKLSYNICKYVVDEENDLTTIPGPEMGDSAYVIHTGDSWILDSEGYWYESTATKDAIKCDCVSELTIWKDLEEPVAD